jgi:hypothetical protein
MSTLDQTSTIPANFRLINSTTTPPRRSQSQPFSVSSPGAGFGEYEEFFPEDFKAYQTTHKTHALIVIALIGVAVAGVVAATVVFPTLVWIAPIALIGLAVLGVCTYLKYRASQNHFPPSLTAGLNPQDFQAKRVGEFIDEGGSAIVLSDSTETRKCRLDLIRNAQSQFF